MKLHGLCDHSYDLQNIEIALLQIKYQSHFKKLRKSSLVSLVFVDRSFRFKSQGTSRWTIVLSYRPTSWEYQIAIEKREQS